MNADEPLTWAEFIRLTRPRAPRVPRPRPAQRQPLPRRERGPVPGNPVDEPPAPAPHDAPAARCGRAATASQRRRADDLFDRLSSLLREAAEPGAADPAALLRRADRAFEGLHRHLARGGALPGPWRDALH